MTQHIVTEDYEHYEKRKWKDTKLGLKVAGVGVLLFIVGLGLISFSFVAGGASLFIAFMLFIIGLTIAK